MVYKEDATNGIGQVNGQNVIYTDTKKVLTSIAEAVHDVTDSQSFNLPTSSAINIAPPAIQKVNSLAKDVF